ncbi:2OG-Fe(II) oxygenase [Chroococcidiopsis sp.]|uniref:2OG-Fe(II) oxygenase n=1 Tax=Chroococcidiopsis sp. TaxID=3088168 RepID=UPI003F36F1A5
MSFYHLEPDFLSDYELANLLQYVAGNEARFDASSVLGDPQHRRSRVLHDFPIYQALFRQKIGEVLAFVLPDLGVTPFPVAQIECQLTASGDGDYFRLHADNCNAPTATRRVTYVYYFHAEPKCFTGGELVLHGRSALRYAPQQNSIIFFESGLNHEVLPVCVPSKEFMHGRFTVNGWVRERR